MKFAEASHECTKFRFVFYDCFQTGNAGVAEGGMGKYWINVEDVGCSCVVVLRPVADGAVVVEPVFDRVVEIKRLLVGSCALFEDVFWGKDTDHCHTCLGGIYKPFSKG